VKLSLYLSRKIYSPNKGKEKSGSLVRIATVSILLSTLVLLFTVSIVRGFQDQITEKATYFSPNIKIHSVNENTPESRFFLLPAGLLDSLNAMEGIKSVYPLIHEPGVIEHNGKIKGVTFVGAPDSFFKDQLQTKLHAGIGLSSKIMQELGIELQEKTTLFLNINQNRPKQRKLAVDTTINIGITSIDESTVWVPLKLLQSFLKPGPKLNAKKGSNPSEIAFSSSFPDAQIGMDGGIYPYDSLLQLSTQDHLIHFVNTDMDTLVTRPLYFKNGVFDTQQFQSNYYDYFSSIGLFTQKGQDLYDIDQRVFSFIPPDLTTTTVREAFPEIFGWLELLNTNIWVLISLIGIVGATNGATALLVIILEKTAAIGILKGVGASPRLIRSIFWQVGFRILAKGILLGNLLFFAVALTQNHFHFLKLNSDMYFLDFVPFDLGATNILIVNGLALAIGSTTLYLSTVFLNKIKAAKALRFNP